MARQLLLFLLSLTCCGTVSAQHCVVSNLKQNVMYIGLPNPLDIAVEGRLCKDLKVSVSDGKISPTEAPCSYIVSPGKQGKTIVTISDRKSSKVLGRAEFRVKHLPDPVAMIAGKSGGEIQKKVLMAQLGIIAVLRNFDFDARFTVTQYTVTMSRRNEMAFSKTCMDARFPEEVTNAFATLHTNDKVFFTDMSYRAPDGRIGQMSAIEFRIID